MVFTFGAEKMMNSISAEAKPLNVLFLCTHNSARSILAEALLNHLGQGRFKGYSAGSHPRPHQMPHPLAIEVLRQAGVATEGLCSKSWDAFAQAGAPSMDLVITVCDSAAGEVCPLWPGQPATAHWGYEDPSAGEVNDDRKREAFARTLGLIRQRINALVNQPPAKLTRWAIEKTARDLAEDMG